ncbi:hypothetical protein KV697_14190 [Sphingomonas sanguinis]|uniref:hypothetical protein n=1 Tax=Sphingomonas sanguinis TaxID=33051 RepID=UPI001C55FB4F|nr:hypothetical protein [Sphingomonas sanguinis]QXT34920.1 hypothetical protein KV697_14190 [Sphingomonas sanguinis]
MLADAPPATWSRAITRIAAIRRYLEEGDRSVESVDRHAAAAGIGRSLFYRLTRTYSVADVKSEGRSDRVGAWNVHEGTLDAVSDAMDELGAGASLSMVLERSRELCRARGVPLATSQIVRTRYGRNGAGTAIGERVRLTNDFAFDRTALELVVPGGDGMPCRAVLSCIVDMRDGVLSTHALTAGNPSASDVRDMFALGGASIGTLSIAEAERCAHGIDIAAIARDWGFTPLLNDRRRSGAIVRAAVGSRLGRIELVERRGDAAVGASHVDLGTARCVVDHLIDRHASARRSSYPTQPRS